MNKKSKKNIVKILRNYKRIFDIVIKLDFCFVLIYFVETITMGIIPIISIRLTQRIVNEVQMRQSSVEEILKLLMVYIMINIITMVLGLIMKYYTEVFQYKLNKYIDVILLEKAGKLALTDFENSESYNKIQRAKTSNKIYVYFTYSVIVLQLFITLILSMTILIKWKWWSVFIILITSLISTFVTNKLNEMRYIMLRNRTESERERWYYQFLMTNDLAFKEIKLYDLSKFFIGRFADICDKFIKEDRLFLKKANKNRFLTLLLEEISIGICFLWIALDTFGGKILIGDFVAYINTLSNVRSRISGVMSQISLIYNDNLYIEQIFEYLDMPQVQKKSCKQVKINEIENIKIINLSFKYPSNESKYVLKNINLTINKGDNIAIVGQNGSGKSTLIKIISGLYENYEGSIYINDVDLRVIDKSSLNAQVSILFQDFTKYEMSLRENITVSNISKMKDDKRIQKILKEVNLEKYSNDLEQQLGFWFNNGRQLSGGQWIDVGIGRVLFREASLLIFDEPNAALDSISEKEIFKEIRIATSGKISLIITHRISSIPSFAGKIIVLDNGELVGYDEHNNLMNDCEIYKDLYNASLKNRQV